MEVSNKTLAILLIGAITVSIAGVLLSLNKIDHITGYATSATGTASVYVNTTQEITFSTNAIDWGTGSVNATTGAPMNCTLDSENLRSPGCIGFTQNNAGFILRNDGNAVGVVRLYSNYTAAQLIGGDSQGGGPLFQYRVTTSEAGSCTTPLPAAYTDLNTTNPGSIICNDFQFNDTKDTLRINVKINIPYTAPQGQRNAPFYAQISSS